MIFSIKLLIYYKINLRSGIIKNFIFVVGVIFFITGCSSTSTSTKPIGALETYNHAMFNINNKIDKAVIRPLAKGYRAITTEYIREHIGNVFHNLEEPIYFVNNILQGEFSNSGVNLGRFVMNTTIGIGGVFDVASTLDMKRDKTGFDETLANWCVPDGPYIVLPILGPSTPRATVGWVADKYTSPSYWVAENSDNDVKNIYYATAGLKMLNFYADHLTMLESLEEGSIDYYESVKAAYLQSRGRFTSCGRKQEETPSYDFDMDMDFDEY